VSRIRRSGAGLPANAGACTIGRVGRRGTGIVVAETGIGGERVLDLPSGERLPHIR